MLRFDLNNRSSYNSQFKSFPYATPDPIDEIPDPFKCPISWEPMKDPVFASDGHAYDRQNIQKWIASGSHKSPLTNETLADDRFVTAWPMRQLMEAHPRARQYLRPPQDVDPTANRCLPIALSHALINFYIVVTKSLAQKMRGFDVEEHPWIFR